MKTFLAFVLGLVIGSVAQTSACHGQQKQIIYDSHGNRIGTIEQPFSWNPRQVIYDNQGNRKGTIDPQGFPTTSPASPNMVDVPELTTPAAPDYTDPFILPDTDE